MVFHGRKTESLFPRRVQGRANRGHHLPTLLIIAFVLATATGCSSSKRHAERNARGHFAQVFTQDLPPGDDEARLDQVGVTDAEALPETPTAAVTDEEDEEPFVELSAESKAALDEIEKEILSEKELEDSGENAVSHPPSAAASAPGEGLIPVEINRRVREWIYYFSVVDRDRFQSFLNRGEYYRPLVEDALAKNGIPRDLFYLAMIESGYVPHARSRVNAVGFWQFMRPTGREQGLKIARGVDERRDIVRSTDAAAKYLKWLHRRLGSWYLAIAAYNGGVGRVQGAVRRGGTRNFWTLARLRALPPETRHYVPKFLAATIVGKHPEKYGFKIRGSGPAGEEFPAVRALRVHSGRSLASVSREADLPVSTLKALNPHLVDQHVPSLGRSYPIWVPVSVADVITRESASPSRHVSSTPPPAARKTARHAGKKIHVVRRGEHLRSISSRYGISISVLKKANRLRGSRILAGQRLRIPASG